MPEHAGNEEQSPKKPMRYSVGDMAMLSILIAVHFMFFQRVGEIRAIELRIATERIVLFAVIATATAAAPAYLTFRFATEFRIVSLLRRAGMLLLMDVVLLSFLGLFSVIYKSLGFLGWFVLGNSVMLAFTIWNIYRVSKDS